MNISRRNMLKLTSGTAAMLAAGANPLSALAKAPKKKIPIGLQLYSVRNDCNKDLPAVLKAVGKMGYDGVEFAGYYGRSADELRKMLDANGLKCCGTHAQFGSLLGDNMKGTIEFNKTLGNKFLIVPSLPGANRESAEALLDTAKLFDELSAKAKEQDMLVGYHAHGGDFKKFDGTTGWDILFGNTCDEFVMQMDIGNCLGGGGDPIATLKRYPGRSLSVHLKEHGGPRGASIGEGDVDWKTVFEICETTGGTQWYVVEQEGYDATPLQCVEQCIKNLRKMGK